MQPQTPSPNPQQYDFIMKDRQPTKKGFKLAFLKLPKPVLIFLGAVLGVIILIIALSVISGSGKSANVDYISAIARAQEISRVSTAVEQLSKDVDTQNLASTTNSALTSAQTQLSDYLTARSIKIVPTSLTVYMSEATDIQMQTAASNGNLASTYTAYLKTQLSAYQASLQAAYKTAEDNGKTILDEAYNSAKAILSSPQLNRS